MNIYVGGILWVGVAALIAALAAYLMRRFGGEEGREENNAAAGGVFSIVAGLNAVLVAFVLIALFDATGSADQTSYREADGLVAAAWASDSLPDATKEKVHDLSRAYMSTVIREEWPKMQDGSDVSSIGWTQLDQLRVAVAQSPVDDEWQTDRKTEAATKLWEVYEARQDRINASGNGVSSVVWFTMIVGSVLSLALALLFGGAKVRSHIVIMATLAATMTLLLYATYQLQNPFSGGAKIGPDAFQAALDRLR
ncbi:hypothetical protein [Umezawaea sp. NPDC059074]|uniref:bestrophin-like domain n=1 Tax=Umezawaea sp. NPDC059074 TaxID=3346716 RepID=UPI00369C8226